MGDMKEWIKVTDRLPEGFYNNFIECMVCRTTLSKIVFHAIFNPKTGKFQQLDFERLDNITHWMPLPNPPES